ncbi:ribonuclease P/MRP protein subunit POP5-like [Haliotis cracherodii]|uniref:ribonuclease P/MRP protein subunit POP5-like n=1 Tax=Haliotis cracherodii TaxID=6455 RepID=UPI0039E84D80
MVRVKRRYLVCEVIAGEEEDTQLQNIKELDVYRAVSGAISRAHGDYGMGLLKKSLNVKYLNIGTGMAFIRVRRGAQHLLQTALAFVKKIGNTNVTMTTLHVAGTIRSCQKFLISFHKQNLPDFLRHCSTPEERLQVQHSIKAACEKVNMYKHHSESHGIEEDDS